MFSLIYIATTISLLIFTLGLDQSFAREFFQYKNKSLLFLYTLTPGLLLLLIFFSLIFFYISNVSEPTNFSLKSLEIATGSFMYNFEYVLRFLTLNLRMKEKAIEYSLSQILQD